MRTTTKTTTKTTSDNQSRTTPVVTNQDTNQDTSNSIRNRPHAIRNQVIAINGKNWEVIGKREVELNGVVYKKLVSKRVKEGGDYQRRIDIQEMMGKCFVSGGDSRIKLKGRDSTEFNKIWEVVNRESVTLSGKGSCEFIYKTVTDLVRESKESKDKVFRILEIGRFGGGTTKLMSRIAGVTEVVSIDKGTSREELESWAKGSWVSEEVSRYFLGVMEKLESYLPGYTSVEAVAQVCINESNVTLITGDSAEIDYSSLGEFDFVFIDGDHSEAMALLDMENCWGILRPGGVMILDDYNLWLKDTRSVNGVDLATGTFLRAHCSDGDGGDGTVWSYGGVDAWNAMVWIRKG